MTALAELNKHFDLTHRDLAKLLGVDQPTITRSIAKGSERFEIECELVLRALQLVFAVDAPPSDIDVKKVREDLGLTTTQLSLILGVSEGTVRNYENGVRPPSALYLIGIARLHAGLNRSDQRVKTGKYRDWRINAGVNVTAVDIERERCVKIVEDLYPSKTAILAAIREGK